MRAPFGQRLSYAVAARGPLCVGIDPHVPLLERWGLPDSPDGLARFTDTVVEALAGTVAVLKPQLAFYERHGSRGLAVLEDGVARARAAGALVLLDAKRGDIGSTMDAYAGYLRPDHPMAADALTVSPYLGPGALQPAVDTARQHGGGLFVLTRTSNPDAGTLQHALVGGSPSGPEKSVAQVVVDTVRGWNTSGWGVGDPPPDPGAVRDLAGRFGATTAIQQYRETLPNGASYTTLDMTQNGAGDNTRVFEVPPGHYFLMGDNRDNSQDSRFLDGPVGFVPLENLVGRADIIFFSVADSPAWAFWKWPNTLRIERLLDTL